ncbi:MAG: hypothetical protein DRP08_07900 [Candidatus Aenigmatarchaeota archaeon]|nr:MAG: hypothetical protein DRP08_07900 [Candidatus Aenigmarchaeota archaeon]
MKNRGWLISNNERGDIVIQKDDDMDRFASDDEATQFVVRSYEELYEGLIKAYDLLDYNIQKYGLEGKYESVFTTLEKLRLVINNIEGRV